MALAVRRYDYDIKSVIWTGTNVAPGTDTDAGLVIGNFIAEYENKQRLLLENIYNAFYDTRKIETEDGERFDITAFESDSPLPQEWGWDSQPWDYTVIDNGQTNTLVRWEQGQVLPVMFSEFPNFAVEEAPEYGNDRIGWHMYNSTTKAGVERVDYSKDIIYVVASGIPDHNSNWNDSSWPHIDADNPNIIKHQNARWNIPGK